MITLRMSVDLFDALKIRQANQAHIKQRGSRIAAIADPVIYVFLTQRGQEPWFIDPLLNNPRLNPGQGRAA